MRTHRLAFVGSANERLWMRAGRLRCAPFLLMELTAGANPVSAAHAQDTDTHVFTHWNNHAHDLLT